MPPQPPPPPASGWGIIQPGKIPQPAPDNQSTWLVYQKTYNDTYQVCASAAAAAVVSGAGNISAARYFTWWGHVDTSANNITVYRCWLATPEGWSQGYVPSTSAVKASASGFRGVPSPIPSEPTSGVCPGDCDCGPGIPCGEYLFDHRNQSLREYLVKTVVLGTAAGLGNPNVDGFYFDDAWTDTPNSPPPGQPPSYEDCSSSPVGGPTEEDSYCSADMGLTKADTTAIVQGLAATMDEVMSAIIKAGGFSTRMMPAYAVHATEVPTLDPRPPARCNAFMRRYCRPNNPNLNATFTYEWTRVTQKVLEPLPALTQDLARFLLVRGPYAYIGWQWVGCRDTYPRPPELENDYGTPVDAVCAEVSPGVYERAWTSGTVRMDCNTWEASIPTPL